MAKNDGVLKSGVFSNAVLDELECRSSQAFPPDFRAVAEHVTDRFEQLRKEGRSDQAPTFFWRRDWSGCSSEHGRIPTSEDAQMLSNEDEIRDLLRPLMADRDSRRARLGRAFARYPGLLDRVALDGETGVFLSNLISVLRDYGELEAGLPAFHVLLDSIRGECGLSGSDADREDSLQVPSQPPARWTGRSWG